MDARSKTLIDCFFNFSLGTAFGEFQEANLVSVYLDISTRASRRQGLSAFCCRHMFVNIVIGKEQWEKAQEKRVATTVV